MAGIESILQETRVFNPPKSFVKQANIVGMDAYRALYAEAEKDYEGFWARLAHEHLLWREPFSKALDESNALFYKQLEDGELNASYNCLERNLEGGDTDRVAIIFGTDDGNVSRIAYRELHAYICRFASGLKALGTKKGDRVVIYIPMSVEDIVAMWTYARIGATHSVVFDGFSTKSLQERIVDVGAVALTTADEQMRGGKALLLKAIADEALAMEGADAVKHVIVYRRTSGNVNWAESRDRVMGEVEAGQPNTCEVTPVGAEHLLFILYTSDSTGKPKGVQHSTSDYLLWTLLTMQWTFDLKSDDIFWCTADVGWVMGHSYIAYGPLAAGATQVVFEGVPTYPNTGRFWDMIQRRKVSTFYTAPAAIRSLIKTTEADEKVHPKQHDLSGLRLLGTVGESINPEAWTWYHTDIDGGRCPIVDTLWQTETGGYMMTPPPGAMPLVSGSYMLPLPGIMAAVVDETGHDAPNGQGGILVVKRPWPPMIRTIWGDPERFKKNYFPEELGGKLYLVGDGSIRDKETGYFTIMGRIDDVLNISSHRMDTMEIESALVANPIVAEAAVMGRPDDMTGEAICVLMVLKRARPDSDEAKQIASELHNWVGKETGPIAKPRDIHFDDNLPKTRSGKIMCRLLRSLAKDEDITQDTSTLEDPAILDQLKETC